MRWPPLADGRRPWNAAGVVLVRGCPLSGAAVVFAEAGPTGAVAEVVAVAG